MMRRAELPLRITIPLLVAVVALALAAFSVLYHARYAERGVEQTVLKELAQFMTQRQGAFEYLLREGRHDQLQREISAMGSDPDLRLAMVFDDRGRVLAATRLALLDTQADAPLAEHFRGAGAAGYDALIAAARASLSGQAVLTDDRQGAVALYPVMLNVTPNAQRPTRVAIIFVRRDLARPKAAARAAVLGPTLQYAAVVAGIALLLGSFLQLRVTRRVRRLVEASEQMAQGQLGARAAVGGRDELGQLGRAFDHMAATLDRQQTQLHDAARRLRSLFDHANDIIYIIEPGSGRILDANRRASEFSGYTPDELLKMTAKELGPPGADAEVDAAMRRLEEVGGAVFRRTHRVKSGRIVPVEVSSRVIELGDQRVIESFVRDLGERYQVERQLRAERDFTNTVLDTIDAIVVVLNRAGRIVRFNRACEQLTGFAAAEVMNRQVWEFLIPPEQIDGVQDVFRTLARERLPSRYENEWLTRSGERRLIDWSNSVLVDVRGEIEFVIATGIDITDRRRVAVALEKSVTRYRGLFETSTVSLWQQDISALRALLDEQRQRGTTEWRDYFHAHPEFVARCARAVRVVDVNAQTLRLYGAGDKQEMLASLEQVFTEDSSAVFAEELVAIAEGRSEFHAESVNRTLAGKVIDVLVSIHIPPPQAPGELMIVAILDISERKRVDEVIGMLARRSGEQPLAQFIQDSVRQLAGIYKARYAFVGRLVEPERKRAITHAVWAGDRSASNFTYELDGTPCQDIMDMKAELIPRNAWGQYPRDVMLREMGVESYFGAPLVTSEGRLIGLVSVMDTRPMELAAWVRPVLGVFATRLANEFEREERVAEREALVAELTARNAEMENFVYTISHDLKTPLITIAGFASLIDNDLAVPDAAAARDSLAEIRKAVEQMGAHIRDLLALSRIGRVISERRAVALGPLIATVLEPFAPRVRDSGAQITVAADLPVVSIDQDGFHRVFSNLIDNALRYARDGVAPRIEIGAIRDADELRIFVRDNGVGIRPEYQERIFNLFERVDMRTEGTGVGLAIARRVIQVHGGRLWVESVPGQGSAFWIALPATAIVA